MTKWSIWSRRAASSSITGANSSCTVQHRQPLASSNSWPLSAPVSSQPMPQLRSSSPSMPSSPNSLTMTAMRLPCAWVSKWRSSVVLPLPKKPVTMVAGIFCRFMVKGVSGVFQARFKAFQ